MTPFIETQTYSPISEIIGVLVILAGTVAAWRFVTKKIALLAFASGLLSLVAFFAIEKLETRIDEQGIHYRMFPWQLTMKVIPWEDVLSVSIKKHIPSGRYDPTPAYEIEDYNGLYIHMNKRTLVIGTKKPAEMRAVLAGLRNAGINMYLYGD